MASEPMPETLLPEGVLRVVLSAREAGHAVALATVVSRSGSAPATPGQKLCLIRDHTGALQAKGTVGGGAIERAVLSELATVLERSGPAVSSHEYHLGAELGMCCGGSVSVLIELMISRMPVVIVGAGHVGLATARLLAQTGFECLLVDARDEAMVPARLQFQSPVSVRPLLAEHDDPEVLHELRAAPTSSALLAITHDHQLDQKVLEWGLSLDFFFVGGVGSRAKALRTQKRLLHRGFSAEQVARVQMPLGLDIGARMPEEIAVSIVALLVRVRAEQFSRRPLGDRREQPKDQARVAEAASLRVRATSS